MFGLSFWEIAIILVVALIILGPKKLPELAKSLGKGIREFRRATDDFKSTVEDEMYKPEEDNKPKGQLSAQSDDAEILPSEEEAADTQKAKEAAEEAAHAVAQREEPAPQATPETPPEEVETSRPKQAAPGEG